MGQIPDLVRKLEDESEKKSEKKSGDWDWVYTKQGPNADGTIYTIYYQKTRWRNGKREYLPAKRGGTKNEKFRIVEKADER